MNTEVPGLPVAITHIDNLKLVSYVSFLTGRFLRVTILCCFAVNMSMEDGDEELFTTFYMKPDAKTVLIEISLNGELLAYQEGG